MRRRSLTLVPVLLLTLAACGGSSSKGGGAVKTTPSPSTAKVKTEVSLEADAKAALRNLATAEETYLTDTNKYLAFDGSIPKALAGATSYPTRDFIFAGLVRGSDSYCLVAVLKGGRGGEAYDSSTGGLLSDASDLKADCKALLQRTLTKAEALPAVSFAPGTPSPLTGSAKAGAALRSDLLNLATAEETYLTDNDKYLAFTGPVPTGLTNTGFRASSTTYRYGAVVRGTSQSYCLVGYDPASKARVAYDSDTGGVVTDTSSLTADCKALLAKVEG